MKTTRYFQEAVRTKRPYVKMEWIAAVLASPVSTQAQPDGRIRHWGPVAEFAGRYLRVVTLEDGETVHNAFFDRDFTPTVKH